MRSRPFDLIPFKISSKDARVLPVTHLHEEADEPLTKIR